MTGVRTLDYDIDNVAGLFVEEARDSDRFRATGEPKAAAWQRPDARWSRETGRPLAHFAMITNLPAFSAEAFEALKPVLDGRGEVLPLNVTDAPPDAVAFNPTRVIDALDEDRSDIKRFSSGRVMRIARPVFIPERVQDETIFKVTTFPKALYVTDVFMQAAEAAGVTRGMSFSEDWTTEAGAPEPADGERVYTQIVPDAGPPDELVAHHIIPPLDLPSDSLQRAQAHAQALGIDPDEAGNGVALPRARHEGAYTDSYFDALWERFREARDRDSGLAVLQRIGSEIAAGEFPPGR